MNTPGKFVGAKHRRRAAAGALHGHVVHSGDIHVVALRRRDNMSDTEKAGEESGGWS